MTETWRSVVEEADASAMKPYDEAGLGAPPRELTPFQEKYIKKAKPSLAIVVWMLAVMFGLGYAMVLAVSGFDATALAQVWQPLALIGFAIWLGRRANQKRAVLRRALQNGTVRFARVLQNHQVRIGRGLASKYRYYVMFDLDGRRVELVSLDDGLSMVEHGALIEVVYDPSVPDEIAPTFLLH